jgi:hypothetical protein
VSQVAVPSGVFAAPIEASLESALARVAAFLGPVHGMALGWATVDLDRAEPDLGGGAAAVGGSDDARPGEAVPDDVLLGARCRLLPPSPAGPPVVLLEPSTEGRLAASLARHGEGPVVLYLRIPARTLARLRVVAPASGVHCSPSAPGPFGSSVLVLDGPPSGPHLVVTEAAPAGTIGR